MVTEEEDRHIVILYSTLNQPDQVGKIIKVRRPIDVVLSYRYLLKL